jgi:hypothetical protein
MMLGRIKYAIREFRVGIRNLRCWFPIIWADRDYDWTFLIAIMKRKIQNMQYRTLKVPYEGHKLVADEMGSAVDLLEYFMGDDGWVQDSVSNPEAYESNKKKLMELLYNFDCWWD